MTNDDEFNHFLNQYVMILKTNDYVMMEAHYDRTSFGFDEFIDKFTSTYEFSNTDLIKSAIKNGKAVVMSS